MDGRQKTPPIIARIPQTNSTFCIHPVNSGKVEQVASKNYYLYDIKSKIQIIKTYF